MKILLIDDDEVILKCMQHALVDDGHVVLTALNGTTALRKFKESPNEFDIVVTDLELPYMDGVEITKAIREISDVPICVWTGFGDDPEISMLVKNAGADYLVDKLGLKLFVRRFDARNKEKGNGSEKNETLYQKRRADDDVRSSDSGKQKKTS